MSMTGFINFFQTTRFVRSIYFFVENHFPLLSPKLIDFFNPNLISRSVSKQFINTFNGEQGHGVDEEQRDYPGLGVIHYSLIRQTRPKNVLCIGSLRGYIPAICALACQDNNFGIVDFVDAGYGEETEKSWGADGFWRKINPREHFLKAKLTRIKTYVMTTKEFTNKYPQRTYQYIYIDGDHTYEGVKSDYQLLWSRLEPKGFMTFHDINGEGEYSGATFGVKKFWKEISNKNAIEIPFPKQNGLGILQKKE